MYRIRHGKILKIVKNSPQLPQTFYPLSSPIEILNGDHLAGQCLYDNNDDRVVRLG